MSTEYCFKGNQTNALLFHGEFIKAKALLKHFHWNEADGIWYDYDVENKHHRREYYLSNALPLFAHCYDEQTNVPRKVYNYLEVQCSVELFGVYCTVTVLSFICSEQERLRRNEVYQLLVYRRINSGTVLTRGHLWCTW